MLTFAYISQPIFKGFLYTCSIIGIIIQISNFNTFRHGQFQSAVITWCGRRQISITRLSKNMQIRFYLSYAMFGQVIPQIIECLNFGVGSHMRIAITAFRRVKTINIMLFDTFANGDKHRWNQKTVVIATLLSLCNDLFHLLDRMDDNWPLLIN